MPAYNTGEYIEKAIQSVLGQTFSNWELLVIDDGSPDNLAEIVKKYENRDSRIRLIQQLNQGVSVARNRGIQEAQGKYISFLDSDDYYLPTFLEKLVNRAEETKGELVYCGYIAEGKRKEHFIGAPYLEEALLTPIVSGAQKIGIFTMLVKKEFLNQSGILFTPDCHMAEDWEFIVKILSETEIYYAVREELYFYRHRQESITKSSTNPHREDSIKVMLRLKDFLTQKYFKEDREPVIEKFNQISSALFRITSKALIAGEYEFILKMLKKYQEEFPKKMETLRSKFILWLINTKKKELWKIYQTIYCFRKKKSYEVRKMFKKN